MGKKLVGERGFEPPTPWSRIRDSGVVLNVFNLLQWCFNHLIPTRPRHSGTNVRPEWHSHSAPQTIMIFAPVLSGTRQIAVDSDEDSFERHAQFFTLAAAPLSGVGGLTGTDDVAAGTRRALRF
jgi:hypothetical protein